MFTILVWAFAIIICIARLTFFVWMAVSWGSHGSMDLSSDIAGCVELTWLLCWAATVVVLSGGHNLPPACSCVCPVDYIVQPTISIWRLPVIFTAICKKFPFF